MLLEPVVVEKVFHYSCYYNMGKQKDKEIIGELTSKKYPYGFVSDFDSDTIGKGLNEDVVRLISRKKNEPKLSLIHI